VQQLIIVVSGFMGAGPDETFAFASGFQGKEPLAGDGMARCRPDDKPNEKIGESLAMARAIKDLGQKLEDRWLARTATREEIAKRRGHGSDPVADRMLLNSRLTMTLDGDENDHIPNVPGEHPIDLGAEYVAPPGVDSEILQALKELGSTVLIETETEEFIEFPLDTDR